MPFIAFNEFNQEVTAWQCHDEYVSNGTIFEKFRCAFCEARYHSRNIYKDALIGKAPHFYLAKGVRHIGLCNGEPIVTGSPTATKEPLKTVTKREFDFPEKLTARATPRLIGVPPVEGIVPPGEQEIRNRRLRAGKEHGASCFTTSLLQNIVESKNKLISWCYEEAKRKKLAVGARNQLIKETAESYPLQLFDQQNLNYQSAFGGADYSWHEGSTRIFHAKNGRAALTDDGFVIRSEPTAVATANERAQQKRTSEVCYRITPNDVIENMPRSHVRLLEELKSAAEDGKAIQWYVYGRMELMDEINVISFANLDHLFFRKER
jgi:hypothetical protein